MKILITGAFGFVGKNLTEALKNIRDGKDKKRLAASSSAPRRAARRHTRI